MSTTYKTIAGDTFDIISRKEYGFESEGGRIASANPGLKEPIAPGTSIVIPSRPGALVDSPQQSPSNDPDETALTINGTRFRFWNEITITQQTDSLSTIAFSAPFDPTVRAERDLFRPMSFRDVAVTIGGAPVFKGTLVLPLPIATPRATTVAVSGYSLPGVLEDCPLPISAYPKDFINLDLNQIANAMAAPFGLVVVFNAPAGATFKSVRPKPSDKVLPFLADLAVQRNLVISDNPAGALVFQQSVAPGSPVARLAQGQAPLISIEPDFRPQQYYSHVTGTQASLVGLKGTSFTVKNPHLSNVVRPFTFELRDTQGGELEAAVKAKASRMFGDAISYRIELSDLRDGKGAIWRSNTTLTLVAPKAAIYNEYEFEIREVELRRTPTTKTAILKLVIPGAFSGILPETLPWDS